MALPELRNRLPNGLELSRPTALGSPSPTLPQHQCPIESPFSRAVEVDSSERLWKNPAERLMVGRNCAFAPLFPSPPHFSINITPCSGAKNQSSKDSTDFLHSLASCYAAQGYIPETWLTLYSRDIGYTRMARSTCLRLNPTLDTTSWILFARKS